MIHKDDSYAIALRYHRKIPGRIWTYLGRRGISIGLVHQHLLGWNGRWITIPVKDRNGRIVLLRLAREGEFGGAVPEIFSPPGAAPELYGWEILDREPVFVVIAENEFDRLVLEAQGFPAISWTGDLASLPAELAAEIAKVPTVYACLDPGTTSLPGLRRLASLIPQLKEIRLPSVARVYGGASDFFVKDGHTKEEFEVLMERARPVSGVASELRRGVSISAIVGRYLTLTPSGKHFVALCPFHPDTKHTFFVFERTGTFHCFGCGLHGDAVSFLMRQARLTFPEAMGVLDQYRSLYGGGEE